MRFVPRKVVGLAQQLREDWEVHARDWTQPGFRALAVHRFGAWLQTELARGPTRAGLSRLHKLMFRYVRNHYGIELPATTVVGRRVLIVHQSGIVIHANAVIGNDCVLRQGVTIGAATFDRIDEAPKLGHGVHVGCGAVIIGGVTIGDGARIGPNAVITRDVPVGASVFVNPPRMLPTLSLGMLITDHDDSSVAAVQRTSHISSR